MMLIEGFLLFADERIRNLFDLRVYVDLPEDLQLVRRMKRTPREEYVRDIIIANYRPHAVVARQCAHHVIDGARSKREVQEKIMEIVRKVNNLV